MYELRRGQTSIFLPALFCFGLYACLCHKGGVPDNHAETPNVLRLDAGPRDAGVVSIVQRDAALTTVDAARADADLAGYDAALPAFDSGPGMNPAIDSFGVGKLYPTRSGGREWYLPSDAEKPSSEWNVENISVTRVSAGVFHTVGENGQVRLSVGSPSGRTWWRNVEMTAYFRYTEPRDSNGQERHWALIARGERHDDSDAMNGNDINGGVPAPSGTATWPGYPYGNATINPRCLGASYHGNFYISGSGLLEKEVSHANGYAAQREETTVKNFVDPLNRWFGLKFVVRNAQSDTRVHLELWLDANADGRWQRLTQSDDTAGSWASKDPSIDGCTAAPFSYTPDELLTWAGPWVIFRSDSIAMDFRWLSAREITPLP
jgi:hypothetical protein